MRADLPENELERLAALARYDILDSHPEASYDRITRTARQFFDVPVCVISLVDDQRQFFKSVIGLDVNQSPREYAFCAHGLLQDGPLIVPDATADERFADNPLVTGAPRIRFYAGAQLKTSDGFKLGSLCVIDHVARPQPSAEAIGVLEDLAAQVVELLESRRIQNEVQGLRTDLDGARRTLLADRQRWQQLERTCAMALEAGNMGFWESDEVAQTGQWSDRMFQLLGVPLNATPPPFQSWIGMIHPEDQPSVLEIVNNSRNSSAPFTFRYRVVVDGQTRWITTAGTHYHSGDGNLLGAMGVAWDSSETHRRERALEESEELFRGLSSSCPIGIFRTDMSGNVTYVNPRFAEIWDLGTHGPLDGQAWERRIHPEDLEDLKTNGYKAFAEGRSDDREYRVLFSDGSFRWMHSRTVVLHNREGKAVGTVGTVDDITERRRTLADLQAAKEAAEVANRSKDLFLSNVSHELRTPLNGVLGMAELLLETELQADQIQMLEIVRDSGRSLLTVVNDILDLSRIEACKMVVENAPFDWNTMLNEAISLVTPEARKKRIDLDLVATPGLDCGLVGDAERIKQILLVYLTNALKFTRAGKVTVKFESQSIDEKHRELMVMVCDSGPGISLEEQTKLFQPFAQLDPSTTRKYGGLGLGLAIARRLAELMGGSVGVSSSVGKGSTFWLKLTLRVHARGEVLPEQAKPTPIRHDAGQRVLVVEDNPDNQMVALNMLKKLGWQSDLATDGLVALEMMRQNRYAVVFMDCQMPEMDGYRATREMRAWEQAHGNYEKVPIIALTANAMTGDRERCLCAGMDDYLSKPVRLHELQSALDRWAKQSSADIHARC